MSQTQEAQSSVHAGSPDPRVPGVPEFVYWLTSPGFKEGDAQDRKLRQLLLVTLSLLMSGGGVLWGGLACIAGAVWQSSIPFGYVVVTGLNLALLRVHRSFPLMRQIQLSISLLLPFLFQWSLGGSTASGGMMLWGLLALVGAIFSKKDRKPFTWLAVFLILTALSVVMDPLLHDQDVVLNHRQQEIALTINVCLVMGIVFGLMMYFVRKIDYSDYLEQLVAERTFELQEKVTTIASLLNGMKQAVFAIDSTGRIVPPVSAFARTVFEEEVEGRDLFSVAYAGLNLSKEQADGLRTAIQTAFAFDSDQWQLIEPHFPALSKFYKDSASKEKILKIGYSPIWANSGKIERLLLVVEDITHVYQLEKLMEQEALNSARRSAILQELMGGEAADLSRFFLRAKELVVACRELVGGEGQAGINLDSFLRLLHSFKGEAQIRRLRVLSEAIHESEGSVQVEAGALQDENLNLGDLISHIRNGVEKVDRLIAEYQEIAERYLRLSFQSGDPAKLPSVLNLEDSFRRLLPMVQDLGERFQKKVNFSWTGPFPVLETRKVEVISEAVMHLIRNSVDHGIEAPETRIAAGKSETGEITLSCQQSGSRVQFRYRDDGRGIQEAELVELAVLRNLLSAERIPSLDRSARLELIFLSGLSTRLEVNEISGRGVGMDVVRQRLNEVGGSIQVASEAGKYTEFQIDV